MPAQPKRRVLEEPIASASPADSGEDSMQFLWAISYSDLLMVMLTFFIVFFEFTDVTEPTPIERLVSELKSKAGLQVVEGGGAVPFSVQSGPHPQLAMVPQSPPMTENLLDSRHDLKALEKKIETLTTLQLNKKGNHLDLIVNFPDDIYPLGEFTLSERGKAEMEKILSLVRPYADQVALVFVGHTDDIPVKVLKHHLLDSNMVLSNLRSSYAVNYAINQGFDPRWVSSQGMAEYSRNTRSLSLRIMERGIR